MLDLIRRISNRNAIVVTERLLERKDMEKHNLGETKLDSVLYGFAKTVYTSLITESADGFEKYQKLRFFLDNIESNEQFIVNYLKSTLWDYNRRVEDEIERTWKEAGDLMNKIGK
ncbi:MAG: hypothetical protein Q8M15_02110 [Bacteroidota bacterium]|nr:hypothetical protein [Bacteroidota bacterium]